MTDKLNVYWVTHPGGIETATAAHGDTSSGLRATLWRAAPERYGWHIREIGRTDDLARGDAMELRDARHAADDELRALAESHVS